MLSATRRGQEVITLEPFVKGWRGFQPEFGTDSFSTVFRLWHSTVIFNQSWNTWHWQTVFKYIQHIYMYNIHINNSKFTRYIFIHVCSSVCQKGRCGYHHTSGAFLRKKRKRREKKKKKKKNIRVGVWMNEKKKKKGEKMKKILKNPPLEGGANRSWVGGSFQHIPFNGGGGFYVVGIRVLYLVKQPLFPFVTFFPFLNLA